MKYIIYIKNFSKGYLLITFSMFLASCAINILVILLTYINRILSFKE